MTDRTTTDSARRIALLGAPIDMGASQRGTLMGPAALRTAGLATLIESLDVDVVDYGDLSVGEIKDLADRPPEKANHYREIQRWTRVLSRRGYEIAKTGAIPIFLGGGLQHAGDDDHGEHARHVGGVPVRRAGPRRAPGR